MASQPMPSRRRSARDGERPHRARGAPTPDALLRWLETAERQAQATARLVGRNLRLARVRAGLSQRELHERSGIAQSHLSHLERGLVYAKLSTLEILSRVLRLRVLDLFAVDGPGPPRRR